ncbi:MAG TPA: PepSY-associated TM helix domain-containing protein [Flavobacteriales bacterium]|nr:PepSY-associated TM helix domain-containing protein [Flavobacteriales bacterium]
MEKETKRKIRRLNIATHRDLGYFFSSLIIIYCLSGIALNHIDDWNPDFIITKQTITIKGNYTAKSVTKADIQKFSRQVGENSYKVYDSPTPDQVKIYYEDASLHINFTTHKGEYESVSRRPLFYHSNVLHRNSVNGWKWVSDVFAIMLITINITGLFILKGKHGLKGRGKWLILAGMVPPIIAFIVHEMA